MPGETTSTQLSIEEAADLFLRCEILSDWQRRVHVPQGYVSSLRKLDYVKQWEKHDKNFWYHLKLIDGSLILIFQDSFKYLMSPYENMMQFDEFVDNYKQQLIELGFTDSEADELSDNSVELYEQYLDTELKLRYYTPVRVDISHQQYDQYCHPLCHLHIGHQNDSRLAIKKEMTPYSFCAFVLYTFYPKCWAKVRKEGMLSEEKFRKLNQSLNNIAHTNSDYWCDSEEEHRFYLF